MTEFAQPSARSRHEDLVETIASMRAEELLPKASFFARVLKRSKQLSARSTQRLIDITQKAREQAGPLVEKAKETGRTLYDRPRRAPRS